jgi:FkbM family methyltransferase
MLIDIKNILNKFHIIPLGVIHLGAHKAEELKLYKKLNIKNVLLYEANKKLINYLKFKSVIYSFLFNMNIKIINKVIYDKKSMCKLNITSNSQSSSILDLGIHKELYPDIVKKEAVLVEGNTLDDEFSNFYDIKNYNFLNIDIQGAELLALSGAQTILSKLDIIYTEINYDYVYKNCALVSDIDNLLKKYNFIRYYTSDVKNKKNISVWGDAIYLNKKLVQKYNYKYK